MTYKVPEGSSQTILCFYFDRETDVLHVPCSQGKFRKHSIISFLGLRVGIWTSPLLKIKSNKCSASIKTRLSVGIMLSERWFHAQTPYQYPDTPFPWDVWSLNNSVAIKVILNVNESSLGSMFCVSLLESRAVTAVTAICICIYSPPQLRFLYLSFGILLNIVAGTNEIMQVETLAHIQKTPNTTKCKKPPKPKPKQWH